MADATRLQTLSKQNDEQRQATKVITTQIEKLTQSQGQIDKLLQSQQKMEAMMAALMSQRSNQLSQPPDPPHSAFGDFTSYSQAPQPPDPPDFNQFGQRLFKFEFPKFDGTLPREWFRRCDEYFYLHKTPPEMRVRVASPHMIGKALQWYIDYNRNNFGIFPPWLDFSIALSAKFGELLDDPLFELMSLKQCGDSVETYLEKFGFESSLLHTPAIQPRAPFSPSQNQNNQGLTDEIVFDRYNTVWLLNGVVTQRSKIEFEVESIETGSSIQQIESSGVKDVISTDLVLNNGSNPEEESHPEEASTHKADTVFGEETITSNASESSQVPSQVSLYHLLVFDGTLPDCWIAKADRFFELEQYGNEEKLDLISLSVEGAALKWFRRHKREFTDWTDIKRKLMGRFGLVKLKGCSPPEVLPKEKLITKVDQDTNFGSEKESPNLVEITSIKGHEVKGTIVLHSATSCAKQIHQNEEFPHLHVTVSTSKLSRNLSLIMHQVDNSVLENQKKLARKAEIPVFENLHEPTRLFGDESQGTLRDHTLAPMKPYQSYSQSWYELDTIQSDINFKVLVAHECDMVGDVVIYEVATTFEKLAKTWKFKFKSNPERSKLLDDILSFMEKSSKRNVMVWKYHHRLLESQQGNELSLLNCLVAHDVLRLWICLGVYNSSLEAKLEFSGWKYKKQINQGHICLNGLCKELVYVIDKKKLINVEDGIKKDKKLDHNLIVLHPQICCCIGGLYRQRGTVYVAENMRLLDTKDGSNEVVAIWEVNHFHVTDFSTTGQKLLLVKEIDKMWYKEDSWLFMQIILKGLCASGVEMETWRVKKSLEWLNKLTTATNLAQMFMDHVCKLQGTPQDMLIDRDPTFQIVLFRVLRADLSSDTTYEFIFVQPRPVHFPSRLEETSFAVDMDRNFQKEEELIAMSKVHHFQGQNKSVMKALVQRKEHPPD